MKRLFIFFFGLILSMNLHASNIEQCFDESLNEIEFNECVQNDLEEGIGIEQIISQNPEPDPGYDCSVYRNYRDRDGNFVCPSANYDECLKEYGPRLPPPYFEFVKHWCWCNCVYDPEDLK